eukprot:XP_764724.1 hypothetical protein [Theileria parva strain Muguga]
MINWRKQYKFRTFQPLIEYSKHTISKRKSPESQSYSDDIKGKIAKVLEIRDMINKKLATKSSISTDKSSEPSSSESLKPKIKPEKFSNRKITRFDCKSPNSVRTLKDA